MKRIANQGLIVVLLLALTLLPGCGTGGTGADQSDTLSGSLSELLSQLHDGANSQLNGDGQLPATFDDPVSAENCQGVMGLTPGQLAEYVAEASVQTAAVTTHAYAVVLARCLDAKAAATVAQLIAQNYDSGRWICVLPDESFVVNSGSYVLLVSASTEQAEALKATFSEMAGSSLGETNVFYRAEADSGGLSFGN